MGQPDRRLYVPPPERSETKLHFSLESRPVSPEVELENYDITIPPSLLALQAEYAQSFAEMVHCSAETAARREALKKGMECIYHYMIATAVQTFYTRTQCIRCKQTPITSHYLELNHALPKGGWCQWKDLTRKMVEQRPEVLGEADWTEFLGEMKRIEMWYYEDNIASADCGRVSWNGNIAPFPIPGPGAREAVVVKLTDYRAPLPHKRKPRPYKRKPRPRKPSLP